MAILDRALDCARGIGKSAITFLVELDRRVIDALENEFEVEVVVRRKVKRKLAPHVEKLLSSTIDYQIATVSEPMPLFDRVPTRIPESKCAENASAAVPADSARSLAGNNDPTRGQTAESKSTAEPAVSKSGKLILEALLKHAPTLLRIKDICKALNDSLCDRTIRAELNQLINHGLVERPMGPNKGARLTPKGKALAEKPSPPVTERLITSHP